ncbi:uncharacterized protein B0H18DRAFT_197649 [Fomitopsis serialis]|uniref:uncharacterized protein n=1 Tax=Fomitopsis serialis TaxID=139415 RepID=UPI00200749E3|nr:uncharacterized protein B0H18DRAFT_197649 [Neoantrodia serialis]KAH9937438.1 hypothetical protein B0H18DRAFT_197649 [Neoantrodia serialis]
MALVALCCILALCLCSPISALPVGTSPPVESSLNLFPLAFSPLVILVALKLGYLKLRRTQLIHPSDHSSGASSSLSLRVGAVRLHLKLVQTTFLTGFLGSPAWETRAQPSTSNTGLVQYLRRGAPSCTPSPVLYSRILGGSSRNSRSNTSARQRQPRRVLLLGTHMKMVVTQISTAAQANIHPPFHVLLLRHPCLLYLPLSICRLDVGWARSSCSLPR